ncbi:hypothetical protein QC761_407870 [Podospora bellae-mahoneyi]|uniref:Secreted protein n=1 Tax=Podospora bellae-mahoneyi TaxID=2093777 RepID=A0ABR0FHP9_9PEZI|nr:hypothetical protein QC761_407870 [Podospora bellae-mahoneyi]
MAVASFPRLGVARVVCWVGLQGRIVRLQFLFTHDYVIEPVREMDVNVENRHTAWDVEQRGQKGHATFSGRSR